MTDAATDVTDSSVSDRVMGLAAVGAPGLCYTPMALTDMEAAALPLVALMASRMLRLGGLRPDARVLVHGAAGGGDGFAVRLARRAGATGAGTASAASSAHAAWLGADPVIDHAAERFGHHAREVDLVVDLMGDPVFERSLGVLAPEGGIVSAVELAAGRKRKPWVNAASLTGSNPTLGYCSR